MSDRTPYELEICIDSVESAIGAQSHGADRVELCIDLDCDGLTPSSALIEATRNAIDIGLYVIIRPHDEGFCYSTAEIEEMLLSIEMAKSLGADGIVSGALLSDGHLDVMNTKKLITASHPLPFTFHRAFDVCTDSVTTYSKLEELGVERLLTSGQGAKAIDGIELIEHLCAVSDSPQIMAGSGVSADNIEALWNAGIRQFHFTSHIIDASGVNRFDPGKIGKAQILLKRLSSS